MEHSYDNQNGSVLVLFAVSVTMIFVITAIVLDLGYIALTKSELQNAADSAALAGVLELIDEDAITRTFDQSDDVVDARDISQSFSLYNKAASKNV
ncbi:Tad domain-containing protein, partial [bacterium]|nr:Tad domain-containing protein [bacterium]